MIRNFFILLIASLSGAVTLPGSVVIMHFEQVDIVTEGSAFSLAAGFLFAGVVLWNISWFMINSNKKKEE